MERISKSKYGTAGMITSLFVLLLLVVFPLFVHKQYIDILSAKYMFFYISVITMTILVIGSRLINKNEKAFETLYDGVKRWMAPDVAVLSFWILCLLSTLLSYYFYESFWGNEGRYCGFFLLTIFTLMYFVVSRKLQFSQLYIDAFLIGAMLVCLWGISDFFQLDIFGFRVDLSPGDQPNFTSSFGNINTYTAYLSFVIGVSGTMFIATAKSKRLIWYTICIVISFFAIIVGWSDNAYLALAALFGFIPFYAFRTKTGAKRYLMMLAVFATVAQCVTWVCVALRGKVVEASSLFNVLGESQWLFLIVILLWGITICVYKLDGKMGGTSWGVLKPYFYKIWIAFIFIVLVAISALLFDANTAQDPYKYGALSKYLVFNDEWGTHRLYNWKLGIANYREFSLLHKIFGYGPETYGIVTVTNNYTEMVNMFHEKYDNAHNEYLQYFITIGPMGLLAYLGMLVSGGRLMIKKAINNPGIMAMFFAVICYAVQAAVNIATPMTTPFVWLFLAMGVAACRNEDSIKEFSKEADLRAKDEE